MADDAAGGDAPLREVGGPLNSMEDYVVNLKLRPILLQGELFHDDKSDAAKDIDRHLPEPALYADMRPPGMPLFEPTIERNAQMWSCCTNYTLSLHYLINWVVYLFWPVAMTFLLFVRFLGYMLYYFWAVPCRYITIFLCQPFFDGLYRICRPPFVFLIVFFRPVASIFLDCCAACGRGIGPCVRFYVWMWCCPWRECCMEIHKENQDMDCCEMAFTECIPCVPTCVGPCIPLTVDECLPYDRKVCIECCWPIDGALSD